MAKLIYALNQSLDGYVDDMALEPAPVLFRHFIDDIYELMRYWDDERPEWNDAERDFAPPGAASRNGWSPAHCKRSAPTPR